MLALGCQPYAFEASAKESQLRLSHVFEPGLIPLEGMSYKAEHVRLPISKSSIPHGISQLILEAFLPGLASIGEMFQIGMLVRKPKCDEMTFFKHPGNPIPTGFGNVQEDRAIL